MVKASISTLKSKLSDYLKLVRKGEEVLITDRGLPVARIVPLGSTEWMKTHMRELVERGLAKPPTGKLPKDFWKRPRPADPEGLGVQALIEERREGR